MSYLKQIAGVAALSVAVLAGCARAARPGEEPRPANGPVVVDVRNDNWNTIMVYALSHGQARRIGQVETATDVELKLPTGVDPTASDFELLVDPIGSRETYRTGRISVGPGDRISLRVANDLAMSNFSAQAETPAPR